METQVSDRFESITDQQITTGVILIEEGESDADMLSGVDR